MIQPEVSEINRVTDSFSLACCFSFRKGDAGSMDTKLYVHFTVCLVKPLLSTMHLISNGFPFVRLPFLKEKQLANEEESVNPFISGTCG